MNDFDKVATYYDKLARLVFGKSIKNSQSAFFNTIMPNNRILICGGGTGWILDELDGLGLELHIEYVEYSKKMIELSKQRGPFENIIVDFFHASIIEHQIESYDVIITNFFLDVFNIENLKAVIQRLKFSLNDSGSWIVTDFRNTSNLWHKFLNGLMHLYFRIFCSLESYRLQDFEKLLLNEHLRLVDRRLFYNGFIGSYHFKLG